MTSVDKNNNQTQENANDRHSDESPRSNEPEVYPLENDIFKKLTTAQKLQILIMTLTVVPIRIFFAIIVLLILWPLGIIATRGHYEKMKKEPISGWRKKMIPIIRFFSRSLYFVAGFHWISVYGEPDKNVRILVTAPHSSYFDSIYVVYMSFISMIARLGADEVLLFGNLTKLCHPIIVNRDKKNSRSDTVASLMDRLNSNLDWPKISIFPEGTCTNRKALVQYKTGAFIPGLPVQPVCIKFSNTGFDSISWTWEGPGAFTVAWLTLCQIHSPIEFHFLPVYYPNEAEKKNATLYAENVRKLMGNYLNVPLSDYSYEDGILVSKLAKYNFPIRTGLIKIQNLRKKLKINEMDEIFKLIPDFVRLARTSTGECYFADFSNNLGLKMSNPVSNFYNLFDKENVGHFNFKSFLVTYIENINAQLNNLNLETLSQELVESLDKFRSDSVDGSYELDDLNSELKLKFDIEFLSTEEFKLKNTTCIDKKTLMNFFKSNLLHIYLFKFVSKKASGLN